jgi:hypothetical protein
VVVNRTGYGAKKIKGKQQLKIRANIDLETIELDLYSAQTKIESIFTSSADHVEDSIIPLKSPYVFEDNKRIRLNETLPKGSIFYLITILCILPLDFTFCLL